MTHKKEDSKPDKEVEKKVKEIKIDLDKDAHASGQRLLELKRNRHNDDIPLDDEYWKALKAHNKAFGVTK